MLSLDCGRQLHTTRWIWYSTTYKRRSVGMHMGLTGKANGPGTLYKYNGDRLECTWIAGKASGHGIRYFISGDRLEGQWED